MTTTQSTENLTNGEENETTYINPAFHSQDDITKTDDVPKTDEDGPEKREEEVVIEVFTIYEKSHKAQKDEADEDSNCCSRVVTNVQTLLAEFYHEHHDYIRLFVFVVLVLAYGCYVAGALWYRFGDNASIQLLVMTCVLIVLTAIAIIIWTLGDQIYKVMIKPLKEFFCHNERGKKVMMVMKWILRVIVIVLIIIFHILGVGMVNPNNLVSLGGLATYVLLCFIFSKNPAAVKWRPVIFGLLLQFILGLLFLRTSWGYLSFEWIGERTKDFLDYVNAGSIFVFGEKYTDHFVAFKILPVIVYFSTVISMLYYLGVMQVIIRKMSLVMQFTMGTTAGESLNAAGNIFVGMGEAPLMIRPLLQDMTKSELHAIMTGGFATIAGSVFAAYVNFGAPANHLLSASVMSAPAALAVSKLLYPETKKSKQTSRDIVHMEKSPERNIFEAASTGASNSVKLVASIVVNLIAFLALLEFVNQTLRWIGIRVSLHPPHYPYLTFELICSYVFWPLAFLMGADAQHSRQLAELIGLKTFANEFVAYQRLGAMLDNTKAHVRYLEKYNLTDLAIGDPRYDAAIRHSFDDIIHLYDSLTLRYGIMDHRTLVIATYALCGFSNFAAIGIMIGALTAMAPSRKSDIAAMALRAMIAGNVACFMTACIAGLMYEPGDTKYIT